MEKTVSNILLGRSESSDRFRLKWGWITFKLEIKPLTVKQLIAISSELSKVRNIKEETDMFPALMESITDANHICKAIAIATGTRHIKIVTRAIRKLDLKDVQKLFSIVIRQSDPTPFFLTCLQIGKVNILKKQEPQ
jgi:hypothetical protein